MLPAALLVGLALRLFGLGWGLPDLFEEATPFFRAWDLWHLGRPEGFSADPEFYRYPSLVIYAQAIAQGVGILVTWLSGGDEAVRALPADFLVERTPWLWRGRAVTMLFGLGLVGAAFSLGRRLGGPGAGAVAAFAAATNGVLVLHSQTINVDLPAAALTTAALAVAVAVARRPTRRASVWLGVFLGLATSAKYPGAFLVVPALLAHLLAPRDDGDPAWLARLAMTGAAALAAFALTSPYVLIRLPEAWADVASEGEHMRLGHFGVATDSAALGYLRLLSMGALGPIAFAAALAAMFVGVRRGRRDVIVVTSFLATALVTLGAWAMWAERYLLPVLPAWLALAAWLAGDVLARRGRALGVAAGLLVVASGAVGLPRVAERLETDPRTAAREWIEGHVPGGAFLLLEAWGPDLLEPEDLWVMPVELRRRAVDRGGRPLYLVQYLPTYQSQPELSEAFYDLELFPEVDVIVLTGDIGERYLAEPDRFAHQVAFYEDVRRGFAEVLRFEATGREDRWVAIYARPHVSQTFTDRAAPLGPQPLRPDRRRPIAGEAAWFAKLALNYETFGFLDEAVASYEASLRVEGSPPATVLGAATGLARCHGSRGETDRAKAALRAAAQLCEGRPEADRLREMAQDLER